MITIIAGSRGAESAHVDAAMRACPWVEEITSTVSGTARGADQYGEDWSRRNRLPVLRMPADWDRHGRRAGYLRNEAMADVADALVAVWDGVSKGTGHMIDIAVRKGLRIFVYTFPTRYSKEIAMSLEASINELNTNIQRLIAAMSSGASAPAASAPAASAPAAAAAAR